MSTYPLTLNKQAHYTYTGTSSQVMLIRQAYEMQSDCVSLHYVIEHFYAS